MSEKKKRAHCHHFIVRIFSKCISGYFANNIAYKSSMLFNVLGISQQSFSLAKYA